MSTPIKINPTKARRFAVTRQRLAGPRLSPDEAGLLEMARDLGCIQLDPISAVTRTNYLVPWSRLGVYDPAVQDDMLFKHGAMFEYWAHAASIVLTEDYPIHSWLMRTYQTGDRPGALRVRKWMDENSELRDHVLGALRERGPILSKDIEDIAKEDWQTSGWNNGRNVGRMLDSLWTQGIILVGGRKGGQKMWDLAERVLPEWTPREVLAPREVVRRSVLRSLGGLGVGTQKHISNHFTRYRYTDLPGVVRDLEAEGLIRQVEIDVEGKGWRGPWYVRAEDVGQLETIAAGDGAWQPRTTLLSPFDNLIADRARTELMFGFEFRIEIYVPKELRKFGYYVLPILQGDRLIGRIDPLMDRKAKRLNINAVFAEPGAPEDRETVGAISSAIQDLGVFLGATDIAYTERVPAGWRGLLAA